VEVNILWILNLINMSHYDTNLDKNDANYVPLSPLSFLERTKDIYPNYEAIVYESRSYTWAEVYKRCVKFASALDKIGIKTGDTVSIMAFNTPEIFEAHYSIPMVGAVINAINTRLDPKTISYILEHSDAKVLIVDRQFHEVIIKAFEAIEAKREGVSLTYFEFSTLAALIIFSEAAVDIAILEVGLGGRLDSVNVVDSDVSVITNVAIDHTEYLGDTRESIGIEKAGIMRTAKPCICGDQDPPNSVLAYAKKINTPVTLVKEKYQGEIGLEGVHQKLNAAVAIKVIEAISNHSLFPKK